ncbi:MAG: rhomboid family intramembrane serine protease [Planctomycetaceae bacterium]
MLLPINTDAPIYHWPYATLGLIITNVVTFVLTGRGDTLHNPVAQEFLLEFGQGLHPHEWILCNFLHMGWFHLIGNMIFLWGFGIIIEGKLGWWLYLLVYCGIGMTHSAFLQLMMLSYDGIPAGSGGASGIIFGLLAMAVVWAPKNDITCILIILYRGIVFDISILTFSIYYIGLQIFYIVFYAFLRSAFDLPTTIFVTSEVIHLVGAVTGFVVGVVMLKQNWVDCENWDLLAVMRGTYGNQADPEEYKYRQKAKDHVKKKFDDDRPPMPGEEVEPVDEFEQAQKKIVLKTKSLRKMRELLAQGRAGAALTEYERMRQLAGDARLDRPALKGLAQGLYNAQDWLPAIRFMEEYVERFPEKAQRMRLKLAGVMLDVHRRPRRALRILEPLAEERLDADLERHRDKMVRAAEKMIAQGVIELDGTLGT